MNRDQQIPSDPWHLSAPPVPFDSAINELARWGRLPDPGEGPPVDSEEAYASPGRPPWATRGSGPRGLPAWAVVSVVLGSVALLCGSTVAITLIDQRSPSPVVRPAAVPVTTSGTCEKSIVGEYGLIATVTARNATREVQRGTVWVRWPVTGEVAQEFRRDLTLTPGEAVEFPVSETIPAARWFRTGVCSYGWTAVK